MGTQETKNEKELVLTMTDYCERVIAEKIQVNEDNKTIFIDQDIYITDLPDRIIECIRTLKNIFGYTLCTTIGPHVFSCNRASFLDL